MPVPIIGGVLVAAGALLSRVVFTRVGQWAIALLASLGLALGTQTVVMDPLLDKVGQGFAGIPPEVAQWLGFLNVDVYVSIVLSAYVGAAIKSVLLKKVSA